MLGLAQEEVQKDSNPRIRHSHSTVQWGMLERRMGMLADGLEKQQMIVDPKLLAL